MSVSQQELEQIIISNFPEAEFELVDLLGDEDHYQLTIFDHRFVGKSLIAQHKMVNNALKDILGGQLHALKIITKTAKFKNGN
jgi:stress-induced morphogen